MPSRLTKRFVDALRTTEKPYERRDSEVTGFLCRVEPTGLKTFWLVYPFNGKRAMRFRLGQYPNVSVEGARALAKSAAGDVAKGIDPQARKQSERIQLGRDRLATLGVFLKEKYEPWAVAHLKSATTQLQRIRSDFADRLDKQMTGLHPLAVEGIRQGWRKNGKKPRTIERDIQRIQGVLSHAVQCGVLERHPFKGALKKMQYDKKGRVRFLSADEEAALRAALTAREDRLRGDRIRFNTWRIARNREPLPERSGDHIDHLRPMVLLALNTGMRRAVFAHVVGGRFWRRYRDRARRVLEVRSDPTYPAEQRSSDRAHHMAQAPSRRSEPRPGVPWRRRRALDEHHKVLGRSGQVSQTPVIQLPRSQAFICIEAGAAGHRSQHRARVARTFRN